jgi:hypothetical protein
MPASSSTAPPIVTTSDGVSPNNMLRITRFAASEAGTPSHAHRAEREGAARDASDDLDTA